jgi:hypothetical protein
MCAADRSGLYIWPSSTECLVASTAENFSHSMLFRSETEPSSGGWRPAFKDSGCRVSLPWIYFFYKKNPFAHEFEVRMFYKSGVNFILLMKTVGTILPPPA